MLHKYDTVRLNVSIGDKKVFAATFTSRWGTSKTVFILAKSFEGAADSANTLANGFGMTVASLNVSNEGAMRANGNLEVYERRMVR